jgi:hypothetical protein
MITRRPLGKRGRRECAGMVGSSSKKNFVVVLWEAAVVAFSVPLGYEDENGFHFGEEPTSSLSKPISPRRRGSTTALESQFRFEKIERACQGGAGCGSRLKKQARPIFA